MIWGKQGRGVALDFLLFNGIIFEIQMGVLDLDHCSRNGPMLVLIGPIIIKILKLKQMITFSRPLKKLNLLVYILYI